MEAAAGRAVRSVTVTLDGCGMRRLLVRATNWLGDAIMSLPALRAIRDAHTGWHVSVLARPWVADLYARQGFCDEVLAYDRDGQHAGFLGKERLARGLRARGFDRAILLQNALDAAWLAWRARIPDRIGYDRDGRGLLLTRRIPVPAPDEIDPHQRFYYLEMLLRAGLIDQLPSRTDVLLDGIPDLRARGALEWRSRGLPGGPWIGVSPGAAFGTAKRWLPERFGAVAREIAAQEGARIAVFGSPSEAGVSTEVATVAGSRAVALAGRTSLAEYLALASTCMLYLTNDSGSMHAAAALGIPTVAIFGATDSEATGPVSQSARIVREPVDCSPCQLRSCPIEGHPCMTGVSAGRVIREARELLAGIRAGSGDSRAP